MARLHEVRENALGAPETTSYFVPDCLANILDKKVQGIALNCLESLVDWIFSYLYTAYSTLYDLKSVMHQHGRDIAHPETASIHRFRDGTPMYDLTRDQQAGIRQPQEFDLLARRQVAREHDYLTLRVGQQAQARTDIVRFSENPDEEITFSRQAGTRYVVVSDLAAGGHGEFSIHEKEVNQPVGKEWQVDTSRVLNVRERLVGQLPVGHEAYYLARPSNLEARAMYQDQNAV